MFSLICRSLTTIQDPPTWSAEVVICGGDEVASFCPPLHESSPAIWVSAGLAPLPCTDPRHRDWDLRCDSWTVQRHQIKRPRRNQTNTLRLSTSADRKRSTSCLWESAKDAFFIFFNEWGSVTQLGRGVCLYGGGSEFTVTEHVCSIHSLRNRSRILPACVATCQKLSS